MGQSLFFLKQAFKKGSSVGAVAPSGKALVRAMTEPIDYLRAKHIVELGPGTGVVTKELLKRMSSDAQLLSIELHPQFAKNLTDAFGADKRWHIKQGNAMMLDRLMQEQRWAQADVIISSLPLSILPKESRAILLRSIFSHLNQGGQYIQFQYSTHAYAMIRNIFDKPRLKVVPMNIPPAVVYICKK